ncbi:ChaC-like protein [Pisolithus sp. B1]|nr:ChaC-like protein [Pisolithus sp. B1]
MPSKAPYVVFGYGSLIFKPPPHVISQAPGFLKGYVRRFSQKSHDHRGTPENPGRVVTLIHKEDWDHFSGSDAFPDEDVVWGIAYTINPLYESEDGYTLETLDVYTIEDGIEKVVTHNCYVGRPDNPSFVGSEPLGDLADRIWRSVGPSGKNKDYLYQLAESVRKLAPASFDSHLFALEDRVRELDDKNSDETQAQ